MPATEQRLGRTSGIARAGAGAGVAVLLTVLLTAQPSFAQKIYSYEPLMMDPYSTIYVDDGSCSAGKVLRVQGAHKNQRRKKSCVPMGDLKSIPSTGAIR